MNAFASKVISVRGNRSSVVARVLMGEKGPKDLIEVTEENLQGGPRGNQAHQRGRLLRVRALTATVGSPKAMERDQSARKETPNAPERTGQKVSCK